MRDEGGRGEVEEGIVRKQRERRGMYYLQSLLLTLVCCD